MVHKQCVYTVNSIEIKTYILPVYVPHNSFSRPSHPNWVFGQPMYLPTSSLSILQYGVTIRCLLFRNTILIVAINRSEIGVMFTNWVRSRLWGPTNVSCISTPTYWLTIPLIDSHVRTGPETPNLMQKSQRIGLMRNPIIIWWFWW